MLLKLIEFKINRDRKYKYLRMDGSDSVTARQNLCDKFSQDPKIFVFLLSSKVAGLGLNLVEADRAIVLDPDWNPANDNQCIDRLYRIGQKKDVIV